MRTKLRSKFTLLLIVCAALIAVPGAAALAQDTGTPAAPTIQSDKADYAPGELVTLTGSGWQPGESVNIVVNDDVGQSWNRNVNVTADASGNITDSFNLPNSFVAQYSVTATGTQSGTATTSFTDGNLGVRARIGSSSGTNLAVEFAAQSAKVFNSTDCTGTASASNANPFTTLSNGQGYVPSTLSPTNANSASIQAPASVTVSGTMYTFSSWVADGPNGLGVTTTGTTGCFLRTTTQTNDPAWNVTAVYNVVTGTTPPQVSSIARAGSNPTNTTGNLSWTVTFSENVSGVDTGDFALANSGLGGSPAIQSVTQGANASVYTVTASSGTGSGSLGLNLNDNDTIADGANNKLGGAGTGTAGGGGPGNGSFTGEVYTIDRTAANVTLTDVNGAARTFPYSTNANVTSVGGSCTTGDGDVSVTLDENAANPATANCSSGNWTLTLTNALSNEGTYAFAASQTDAAGNTGNSGNKSVTIDKTAPTVTATAVKGPDFTDTYTADTWTNKDVRVTFTCADNTGGSGLTAGSADQVKNFTTETSSTTASIDGTCADNAGNTAAASDFGPIKIDKTAPTVTADAERDPDHNGWYNHVLTVSFSGTDETSGIANCDADVNYSGPDNADKNLSGSCTDDAGNSASDTFNFKYDATKPTISGTKSPGPNSFGWNNGSVTVSYSCNDATSGVPATSCGPNETLSSDGANQSSTGNATDNAGNTASTTVSGINIDKSAPTGIAFVGGSLTDGQSYDFNSVPAGPTGCTADGAISGLQPDPDGCKVTGYSTGVGPHTVTATAKDRAGNTSTKTLSYTVNAATAYGFYQPVDMGDTLNTVKSGSTVPVKFELIGGASNIEQKSLSAVGSMSASKVNCAAFNGDPVDAIEYLAPTSENTGLRFDTTGDQFIYNWKTPAKAANTCYNLTMTAADNTTKLVAYFKLT